jgi:hypothetical protein
MHNQTKKTTNSLCLIVTVIKINQSFIHQSIHQSFDRSIDQSIHHSISQRKETTVVPAILINQNTIRNLNCNDLTPAGLTSWVSML